MWCHIMWCHVISCHVISCHVTWCDVMLFHVMWCDVMSYVLPGQVMSCHLIWCDVMLCHVISHDVISCHVMSCVWCHVKWCHLAMTFSFCFIFGPNKSLYIYHVFYGFSKYLILRKLWILLWTWTRNTSYIFYTFVDNTQHTLLNWVNRKWYCETGRDVTKQSLVLIIEFLRQ